MEESALVQKKHEKYERIAFWCTLTVAWFLFYYKQCVVNNTGDYFWHNQYVDWILKGEMTINYPGYHLIVGGISFILGGNILLASTVTLMLAMIVSVYLTKQLISFLSDGNLSERLCRYLALLVNVVQPIFTNSIRPGYSSGNGYISPTQALCKPFVLLVLLLFVRFYRAEWTIKKVLIMILSLCLSCVAKPLFAMAFIPAAGLLILFEGIYDIRKKILDKKRLKSLLLIFASLFCSGLFLIAQYIYQDFTFNLHETIYTERKGSAICFGFMYAWKMVVSNVWLSILFAYFFPLVLFIVLMIKKYRSNGTVHFNKKTKDFGRMCLAYGFVSFIYISCLYQNNGYEKDLNFRNSWIITFIMVYILAIVILASMIKEKRIFQSCQTNGLIKTVKAEIGVFIASGALGIHLLFGILLFVKNLFF